MPAPPVLPCQSLWPERISSLLYYAAQEELLWNIRSPVTICQHQRQYKHIHLGLSKDQIQPIVHYDHLRSSWRHNVGKCRLTYFDLWPYLISYKDMLWETVNEAVLGLGLASNHEKHVFVVQEIDILTKCRFIMSSVWQSVERSKGFKNRNVLS